MKRKILTVAIGLTVLTGCEQKIDHVEATWARPISPVDGATVRLDYFKPDEVQVFTWEVRPNSTYKIYFDVDMYFTNAVVFDMGNEGILELTNSGMTEMLRKVWPDFSSVKRFFWQVEQDTGGVIQTSWRYFNAIVAVEDFIDDRDGQQYSARQYVLNDGRLMTIMGENLRAEVYSDGEPFPYPVKWAPTDDAVYLTLAGGYYTWATAVRVSWEEAKAAYLNGTDVQGVCPDGWHLLSYDEIMLMRETFGRDEIGNVVKNPVYWKTTENITNSTDLNIVASGFFWHEGVAALISEFGSDAPMAGFWTSAPATIGVEYDWEGVLTDDNQGRATMVAFYDELSGAYIQGYGIIPSTDNRCYPIRCVMDY